MICSSPILYLMKYFPSKRVFLRLSLVLLNKVSFKLQKSKNFLFSWHSYLTLFIKWLFVYKGLKHCPGHWPPSILRDLSQNQATLFLSALSFIFPLKKSTSIFDWVSVWANHLEFLHQCTAHDSVTSVPLYSQGSPFVHTSRIKLKETDVPWRRTWHFYGKKEEIFKRDGDTYESIVYSAVINEYRLFHRGSADFVPHHECGFI